MLDPINDNVILNSIIAKEEELINKNMFRKERLWCQIQILELQLVNPLVSRATKKNIRAWLQLKQQQINEL